MLLLCFLYIIPHLLWRGVECYPGCLEITFNLSLFKTFSFSMNGTLKEYS